MRVIAVLNSKGGTGKSLLSTNLAIAATREYAHIQAPPGHPVVALVDLDPQGGSLRWRKLRGGDPDAQPHPCRGVDSPAEAVDRLARQGCEIAVLDGPPGALEVTEEAAAVADFVLIPLRPGDQDLAATRHALGAVQESGAPFMLVINGARSISDRRAIDLINGFKASGLPIYPTPIVSRLAHGDALDNGLSALELRDAAAQQEIKDLWSAVKKGLEAKAKKQKAKRYA